MADIRTGEVTPPREVLDYFRDKELAPRFSWLDVFGEEHAHAFTVAKAVEADVLAAFRGTIDDAIARGLTYENWIAEIEPRLKSLGWWGKRTVIDPATGERAAVDFSSPRRLRTIFWSNLRAARAAGQWERIEATKAVLPYLIYVLTTAQEPREEHLGWVGIILPVDHEFWRTHFPPNGWGCKCSVRQIGRAEAQRLGGVTAAPAVRTVSFRNRRTGEVIEVPDGIDPGWHTNPGRARALGLGRVLADKLGRIPDAAAREGQIARILGAPEFVRLLAGRFPPRAALPVAELPAGVRPARSATSIALLSTETAKKQLRAHPEATSATYAALPGFVKTAERFADRGGIVHFVGEIDGLLWHAVVKSTVTGQALYLTSLHRIRPDDVLRLKRRAARHLAGH